MPQHTRPVPGLTAREQVAYAGWLKGMSRQDAWQRAATVLARVGLHRLEDTTAATLSGGQLRRVGIAQALIHAASILLLDEPTAGLDPAQRAQFREIIGNLPSTTPVLVSTHQVDDLNEIFETVVVMEEGMVRFIGTVAEFVAHAHPGSERAAESAYASLVYGDQ